MEEQQIQWFPGHMTKTLRELNEIKADIYIVLLDSRAPESSFIDSFKELIENKKVIICLTKSDMVNKDKLSFWVNKYKKTYKNINVFSLTQKQQQLRKIIINTLSKIEVKSILPKIVILGVPNVGKSTLLNVLIGSNKAKTENRPAVTKKNSWYQLDRKYWILDTPGILEPKFISKKQGINLALIGSIKLNLLPLDIIVEEFKLILKNLNLYDKFEQKYLLNNIENDEDRRKIILNFQRQIFGKLIID